MRISRHLLAMLPIAITIGLASPEAQSDSLDNLARDVCFKVHGADAHAIRKYEQEKLFATLQVLKTRVDERRRIAKDKEDAYKRELGKLEDIKADFVKLEYFQRYNRILRLYADQINDKALELAGLESAYDDEKDAARQPDLRNQINDLKAELGRLSTEARATLSKDFGKEFEDRFGVVVISETPVKLGSRIMWEVIPELASKAEQKIQDAFAKSNAARMEAQQHAAPFKESYVAALVELKESMKLLAFMERVIRETEGCRADAKRVAPRRDLVANFKINCRSTEFNSPICMHGTMWINFDAQSRVTGQAGISDVCATEAGARQCVDVSPAQITGATGQIAANALTATVTYTLPSNRPRKDTGIFRFEGRVMPDGNVVPIAWRGTGSVTTTENKFPLPPSEPYVIACSGLWSTESKPACWDE